MLFRLNMGVAIVILTSVFAAYAGHAIAFSTSQETAKAATTSDGVYTSDQAKRGQRAYSETCSACHADDLSGSDQAPPLAGTAFLGNWQGQTADALVERIRMTMPLNDPGSVGKPAVVDIVAYVFQANSFPAGAEELKTDQGVLKGIVIKGK